MPPLSGFSDNPFQTRADYARAAIALVRPLAAYRSSLSARIKIPAGTAAGFSGTAAQLEGFARPLWVIPHLSGLGNAGSLAEIPFVETWIDGLKAGTDPESPEYWGELRDFDQKMVEMESIAYTILLRPDLFSFELDEIARRNLVSWLVQINHRKMPQTNWLWFRVLVNLALYRVLGVPLEDVKGHIDDSLAVLDTFYLGEGWSSDGIWSTECKQADYYSGSFALQFAPLLFIRFAPDYDVSRTERYRNNARQFATQYWRYFSANGAAIPFGRSLSYRFAFSAFWAAVAVAGIDLPAPLSDPGAIKGLLMRHFRWWAKQEHIFNVDGTLHIGFTYPNAYLAEDYTSPQSPYWCLKSFLCLDLPESHPFWQDQELACPLTDSKAGLTQIKMLWPPRHILCNTAEHHFLLSSGQSTRKPFRAREAKYGKFAYSSAFGFNVPCGLLLEQMAPDSTLAVCMGDYDDQWRVRWAPYDVKQGEVRVGAESVPILSSSWKPWPGLDTKIVTTLVAPCQRWPGWHLRIHNIEYVDDHDLQLLDSGFAISAETTGEIFIPDTVLRDMPDREEASVSEGWYTDDCSVLVTSKSGASGVVDLSDDRNNLERKRSSGRPHSPTVMRADPNT
jgi:hypothetical protein